MIKWRGRRFTPEELDGFDIFNVVGAPAQLTILHNYSGKTGKTYASVEGVIAGPQGWKPTAENPLVRFAFEDHGMNIPPGVPQWITDKIESSDEWKYLSRPVDEHPDNTIPGPKNMTEDDDLPSTYSIEYVRAWKQRKIPVGPEYQLVWSDEFDGATLDLSKWDYRQLGPRRDAINVKDTVALDGQGHLVLTTKRQGDEYHTAMIGTQGTFETTFGYFEVRVKLQEQLGHWSAFWLQSPSLGNPLNDPARAGTEIDIFEYLRKDGDRVHHNLHWDGYGQHHKHSGKTVTVPGLSAGWHTVGLLWTESEYVFYIDGEETWRSSDGVSQRDEYLILSLEVGPWAGDIADAKLPDHLYVDYVRVYQRPAQGEASETK